MAVKFAEFKTAYLQRAIPLDAAVVDTGLAVGALVKYGISGTTPVVSAAADLADATHIIAQSDMTLIPEDHPKTDYRDYRYSAAVKPLDASIKADTFIGAYATTSDLPTATSTNTGKTALVLKDGKIYTSTAGGSSTYSWVAGAAAITLTTKHLSLYALVDKTDVKVLA